MSFSNHGRFRQQVRFLRRQFLQDGELPFTNVLSEAAVTQALTASDVVWLDRIYSPLVTLWVFLSQVLSQDHSCRAAVARLVGKTLDEKVDPAWLWKGRPVYMFDGTTVTMPDTPKNQAAYPQVYNQNPGWVFRLPEFVRSCLCRVERYSNWESADTLAKGKGS